MNYVYNGPGKTPRLAPTMQDSLALYNNAVKVINFYKKKGYKEDYPGSGSLDVRYLPKHDVFTVLDKANEQFEKEKKQGGWFNKNKIMTPKGPVNQEDIEYRKKLDNNKFLQREFAKGILNTEAPMQLFDRRIVPQFRSSITKPHNSGNKEFISGDAVDIYSYDPIAVKPVKLLTPQERAERERKYGSISKTTPKQQQVLQIAKKIVPKPIPIQRTVHAPIELLQPKQVQMLANLNNIEQPARLRTMPVPVTPNTSMAQSLRYPAQAGFAEKLMRKFQGKPNIPYWVDEYGNERYPKYGENTAEQVREMRRLTSDLDPQTEEGAKELARIEMLRMMSPEGRKAVMSGEQLSVK